MSILSTCCGKSGLRAGDILVLTKPLGFGLTTTALKRDQAEPSDVDEAMTWMSRLNRTASELAVEFGLAAGTDITGYGLLGHGLEMAHASGLALEIAFQKVPFLQGAPAYARKGAFAGGAFDNRNYFGPHVEFSPSLTADDRMMLFDPQTSGGSASGGTASSNR